MTFLPTRAPGSVLLALAVLVTTPVDLEGGERIERFDRDPGWEGRNHRATQPSPRMIVQDFGFSPTRHAGGAAVGEIGGTLTPAAELAWYARAIPEANLNTPLSASGTIACDEGGVHALVGFFNDGTLNEWRTPNTIALRIQGRGDVFYAYLEYATRRWRAGGDEPQPFARIRNPRTGRSEPKGFPTRNATHRWSLRYDPDGHGGQGVVTATIDDETAICELLPGHKDDGAVFNRFGVLTVMKSADAPGKLWLDDLTINGQSETFTTGRGWDGFQNRRRYESSHVRPRFDFGFSPTRYAGGQAPGELGGRVFRGDCRMPDRLACYGDRVGPLTLDHPIKASGKIALRRGVTDSTTLLGFYHHDRSLRVNPSQSSGFPEGFIGIVVEGPSRDGFFVYPAYRTDSQHEGQDSSPTRSPILPDGSAHDWTFAYDPGVDGRGRITVSLDGQATTLDLRQGDRVPGVTFDRFGLVTTWIDGNGQSIYFDDLTYTVSQDGGRTKP